MWRQFARITAGAAFALAATACSTARSRPSPGDGLPPAAKQALSNSSVDITYTLGHSHRRFLLEAASSMIRGESYLDRTILKQASVEPGRYLDFLQKVSDFVTRERSVASVSATECRAPFTVTFRSGVDTRTLSGCRSADEGSFSRLVKDGEFLLYSQK